MLWGWTIYLVTSAFSAGTRKVTVTGERINERRRTDVGFWMAGGLLLVDLGHFR
jgi:hypothetical protein